MRIAVIDSQGGGIGKTIVEKLRAELDESTEILALGTNAYATTAMLKAGANEGASGENAIVVNAPKVDIIVGCIGILAAGSMLGEITPEIAAAVSMSKANKVLIPLGKCMIHVAGVMGKPLPHYIDDAVSVIKNIVESEKMCEANVYMTDEDGNTELFMESVDKVVPGENSIYLESIFGERKNIKAKIKEMELVHHKIILEKI
jgi:predicted RNA-binding protein